MSDTKSYLSEEILSNEVDPIGVRNALGRSYYCFCLEQALSNLRQARMLVVGDVTDENHELQDIELKLMDALKAS